jgi:hypothetical protein
MLIKLCQLTCFVFSRYNKEGFTINAGLSGFRLIAVTLKLLSDHRLLLLLPLTVWMGVEQVFRGADYTSVSMIMHSVSFRVRKYVRTANMLRGDHFTRACEILILF